MEIHNLLEDEVIRLIDEICDSAPVAREYCTQPECRLDAACFVLNRIAPRYVTSVRGHAHIEAEFGDNSQDTADIVALAHEALRRVTANRRDYYDDVTETGPSIDGPCYVFPTIKGRLINGATFTPLAGVAVELLADGRRVEMIDNRWQNPYIVSERTPGTFLFRPAPVPAGSTGEKKAFEFGLRVEAPKFEPFHHYFSFELGASAQPSNSIRHASDFNLMDLFIVPS